MSIGEIIKTYSPSMDIQISSNFERQLFDSFEKNSDQLNFVMKAFLESGKYKLSKEIVLQKLKKHN